ncbi:MAG TPA: MBL fold metallo-hydrolase [Steroidobacter sp.]|jgi:glyoxylase-like metal-dependent hydrolase (beta-lactamase superfamily II)|nr:MBL fold metallo-hydrolase [Steroidobacteraceae bacterium]HLS80921.1 MBL fold metallo-hydrolase [Steroidobacter sp.]
MQTLIIPVTAFQQNCSLIWDDAKRAAVVDPGGDLDQVLAALDEHDLALEKILLTHAHLDHAAGTAELAALKKVPIEGPQRGDKFWIDGLPEATRSLGFPTARSFEPDRWLEHGDLVSVGSETLEVLHCPGHTPGHVVFFHRPGRFAWVGDVIFAGSIGRTDLPGGDHATLIRSIRERLFTLGDDVRFLPGHGPMSTFGQERNCNPYVSDRALGVRAGPLS